MKLRGHLSRLTAFLGFLVFEVLLYMLIIFATTVAFFLAASGADGSEEAARGSLFWLLGLAALFLLVVLGTAPLWGRRLLLYFTATDLGYWPVAGLAVWLPLLLSLVANAITGLAFGNFSPWIQLGSLLFLYTCAVALSSTLYFIAASRAG